MLATDSPVLHTLSNATDAMVKVVSIAYIGGLPFLGAIA
jgi:hypothetical protein